MARLWQSGFELQSLTAGVEFTNNGLTGLATLDTTLKRIGNASLKIKNTSANNSWIGQRFTSGTVSGSLFTRAYINITTLPSAEASVITVYDLDASDDQSRLNLSTAGKLILRDGNGVQIGSSSQTLSTGVWYRVELFHNSTSTSIAASIDGVFFASTTSGTSMFGYNTVIFGEPSTSLTWEINFDDLAINDSTGSFQNSYPGSGSIVHLNPNAAGDVNAFAVQVGGTVGSSNNFSRVSEITPDDATTYNASLTLNDEDLFNCANSGLKNTDKINVVAVGGRFANIIADASAAFKFEIEKTGSGTKTQSGAIIPNSTTWKTNDTTTARVYPLVTYQDPDSSDWTFSTLDSMQIGYKITTAGVQTIAVSNVFASVDYTPDAYTLIAWIRA